MPVDEGQIARDAYQEFQAEARATLLWFATTYPGVFRRGIAALMEPPQTAATRRQERTLLEALGNQDPAAFEAELAARMQATSFQEVVELLGSGRQRRQE